MNLQKLFLLMVFFIMLSGCYKFDVQQGNYIDQRLITQIHPGMDPVEVENILGTPVLIHPYALNHMVYIYTFQHGHHKMERTRAFVYFSGNRVMHIWTDLKAPL